MQWIEILYKEISLMLLDFHNMFVCIRKHHACMKYFVKKHEYILKIETLLQKKSMIRHLIMVRVFNVRK